MRAIRWLIVLGGVMAAGWAVSRLDLPLWLQLVLEVVIIAVALTALQAYEAFVAHKK